MTYVSLTDQELAVLDGRCSAKVQAEVEDAKLRLAAVAASPGVNPAIAGFVADVLAEATKNGRLVYRWQQLRHCSVCKADRGYATYPRSSRYHRKGDPNYCKPLYLQGVELARRAITIQGNVSVGCCRACWEVAKPLVITALEGIRAEVPEGITGKPPAWRYSEMMNCKACGWTGPELKMHLLPALMSGTYRGGCPACPAENRPLGPRILVPVDGFEVLPASEVAA